MKYTFSLYKSKLAQCVEKYEKEKWKCMFFQYLSPFIKSKIFIIESQYDSWSIPNILGIKCVESRTLF